MSSRPVLSAFFFALVAILAAALIVIYLLPDRGNPSGDPITPGSSQTWGASAPAYPIGYSVGPIDPRFGITRQKLLKLIGEAKLLWEKPAGLELFRYDSSANFTIHMVFDARQQRRIDEKGVRAKITLTGKSFDNLREEYDSRVLLQKELESGYTADLAACNQKLEAHNRKVSHWNGAGGAPKEVFSELNAEAGDLDKLRASVERLALNDVISAVTTLADALNRLVVQYNLQIGNYNGRFVAVREFEKGVFNGKGINIYEFEEEADLRAALVHELGHALGFGHVDDPASIMYYKLERQEIKNLRLTAKDLALLRDKFPVAAQSPAGMRRGEPSLVVR